MGNIGDEVLKKVGQIFLEEGGENAYRFGGEEIVVVGEDLSKIKLISEKIMDRLLKEVKINYFLNKDVNLESGAKYYKGETLTIRGVGITYGIDKQFKRADEKLNIEKRKRTAAGIRSPKGHEIQRLYR